jgi:hypothetical protein
MLKNSNPSVKWFAVNNSSSDKTCFGILAMANVEHLAVIKFLHLTGLKRVDIFEKCKVYWAKMLHHMRS